MFDLDWTGVEKIGHDVGEKPDDCQWVSKRSQHVDTFVSKMLTVQAPDGAIGCDAHSRQHSSSKRNSQNFLEYSRYFSIINFEIDLRPFNSLRRHLHQ